MEKSSKAVELTPKETVVFFPVMEKSDPVSCAGGGVAGLINSLKKAANETGLEVDESRINNIGCSFIFSGTFLAPKEKVQNFLGSEKGVLICKALTQEAIEEVLQVLK